jgi:hypothetical protein
VHGYQCCFAPHGVLMMLGLFLSDDWGRKCCWRTGGSAFHPEQQQLLPCCCCLKDRTGNRELEGILKVSFNILIYTNSNWRRDETSKRDRDDTMEARPELKLVLMGADIVLN